MAEIEEAIGCQFQSLSIVFVCAVNTKLALLFEQRVIAPDKYGAHWLKHATVYHFCLGFQPGYVSNEIKPK
jgi:hypothetical protein